MDSKKGLNISKRPKIQCEVCGEDDLACLERHHIIPRSNPNCTNNDYNLAILCSNCHSKTHLGDLKILGVFPGTRPPTGRILVYKLNGVCNVPGMEDVEPYYISKTESMKVFYE